MKIIIFTASVNIGGIERVFLTYAEELANKGHEVFYVTCWDKGDFSQIISENIRLISLGNIRLRYAIPSLRRIIVKLKPDVILTANDATLIVYLANLLSCSKAVVITSQHSYYDNAESLFYTRLIVKYIFPLCNGVIAVSSGIASMLSDNIGLKNKIKVINNPINYKKIQESIINGDVINRDRKFLLFIGRMSIVKNLALLIDAFSLFNNKNPEYDLLILGDGEEMSNAQKHVKNKRMSNVVFFLGAKSNPYPYIQSSDALILSSTSEAFPTVLIEAMALGKTCVSTPTKGAFDILGNGKFGYISKSFHSSLEFSELMQKAVDQPLNSNVLIGEAKNRFDIGIKTQELIDFMTHKNM